MSLFSTVVEDRPYADARTHLTADSQKGCRGGRVALVLCNVQPSEPMDKKVTVIENATVLVSKELEPVRGADVVFSGERIGGIGPRAKVGVTGEVERVDATGLVLTPGFIDAHVHIGLASPPEVLERGVTTVRDLAWPPEIIFEMAERSRHVDFDGPEIVAAGPMLTAPGGYPTRATWAPPGTGRPVTSAQEARPAVGETADAGAVVVKFALNPEVGPVLDAATLKEIVEAAHERGLKTTGHVSGLTELDKAIAARADELAHMLMSPEQIPQATIEKMVATGMAIVPTLAVRFGRDRAFAIENLARFRAAGGTVVYGTDLGNRGPGPGIDEEEVRGMTEAGFSAREIIASATVTSSAWLGLTDRGTLEVGRKADIVAFPPAVQNDPSLLSDVRMVWRSGRRAF